MIDPICCTSSRKPWITRLTPLSVISTALLVGISYWVPALNVFRESVIMYAKGIWLAVTLGFLFGGLLDRYVPREYVSKLLSQRKKRTILSAVLLGFAMSACSHGILALSMELHKKGASTSVVVAFLLASPWANLPITLMLLSFFGLKALFIILSALGVAFSTGVVFQFLEKKNWVETNQRTVELKENYSVTYDLARRWYGKRWSIKVLARDAQAVCRGAAALADMTLAWILIGVLMSGLAAAFVPHELFRRFMGPNVTGLLVTLALATVIEVCSEGTAPVAFEIYRQTGAFGNAFIFLMAGVMTDFTEISLVWANIGKRAAIWIPAIAVPQVVILGLIANKIF